MKKELFCKEVEKAIDKWILPTLPEEASEKELFTLLMMKLRHIDEIEQGQIK